MRYAAEPFLPFSKFKNYETLDKFKTHLFVTKNKPAHKVKSSENKKIVYN